MHIIIIDSGFGGLNVSASFLQHLTNMFSQPISLHLDYINTIPAQNLGYNDLSSFEQKVETFQNTLEGLHQFAQPDLIIVACNTLSVLLPHLSFFETPLISLRTALTPLLKNQITHREAHFLIFATPTTVASNFYPTLLQEEGIFSENIVSQACPQLATEISNDLTGTQVQLRIQYYCDLAFAQVRQPTWFYPILGCTHYGLRENMFQHAFAQYDIPFEIMNPNESLALESLMWLKQQKTVESNEKISIRFLSKFPLVANEVKNWSSFMKPFSSVLAEAISDYEVIPQLW